MVCTGTRWPFLYPSLQGLGHRHWVRILAWVLEKRVCSHWCAASTILGPCTGSKCEHCHAKSIPAFIFFPFHLKRSTFGLILINVCHPKCLYLAWENSRHFETPTLVSLWNDVGETSAEIPYWRCVTTQIWVVLLIGWKFAPTNRKHYTHPNIGSETSSVWLFCARFSDVTSQLNQ